jgi:thiamine kinase
MQNIAMLSLIASGASADVIRIGSGLVLKLFHRDVEPGIVRRELDSARHAREEGVLVPRPIGCQTVEERSGIVFEELDGKPLLEAMPGIHIFHARHALHKLALAHRRIHRCSGVGLEHEQHDILHVRILAADIDDEVKQEALAQLYRLPRGQSLCHGDFHPGNAMETSAGVAAVDWSSGCVGEPAADVLRTQFLLRYGMYGDQPPRSRIARWLRGLAADFYLREYLRISGSSPERYRAWRLPVLVSCLGKASRMYRPALIAALDRYRQQSRIRVVGAAGIEPATPPV